MLLVVSDTHISDRKKKLPEEFLSQIKPGDIIFHSGDFVSLSVLKDLEQKAELIAVCGNMDEPDIKKNLPAKRVVSISGIKIGIIHGWGSPFGIAQRVYSEFEEKPEVIIFGHAHRVIQKRIGSTWLFNPGSLSGNILSSKSSFGILKVEPGEIWSEVVEF